MKPALFFLLPLTATAPWLNAQIDPSLAEAEADAASFAVDAPKDEPWTFSGYWDNDGGLLKRNNIEDKHYTNGFGFSLSHEPEWAGRVAKKLPFGDGFDHAGVGYMVGHQMFTPDDISETALIEDERPYAGYLFGGVFLDRANDHVMDHLQLNIGVVGPASQAEGLQELIHEWYDGVDPEGWDNQLDDELTVQAYYRRKWRLELAPIEVGDARIESEFIPQAGLALGTVHRHVEGSVLLRMGVNLPDDFGPGRLSDPTSATKQQRNAGWYGYAFGRAGGRVVEHNLFIEGNTFEGSHGVEEEPLVGEVSLGLAVGYRRGSWTGEISYAQTAVTEEFKAQDGGDEYATLGVSLTGWF